MEACFMVNIRKLESELWESADLLRQGSKLSSQEYCMPVLGLIFLRYAYSRFKYVEAEILKDRPMRNGRVLPVEPSDFKQKVLSFYLKRLDTIIYSIYQTMLIAEKQSMRQWS